MSIISLSGWAVTSRIRHDKARLRHLIKHDALTLRPNRQFILDAIRDLIAQRGKCAPFAVHRIDIDHFRLINARYGQEVADNALVQISNRLLEETGPNDLVARVAGDEFLIIQHDVTSEAGVRDMALRICKVCRQPIRVGLLQIEVHCSIGSLAGAEQKQTADEIMCCSDLALIAAKDEGRNCVRLFEKSLLNDDIESEKIEAGLRRAIAAGELTVCYQPIVCTAAQKIKSVEALVRWSDPEMGDVSPGKFIPIAERSGLIVAIGRFVLLRACTDIARMGIPNLCIAVNISAVEFRCSDVVQSVRGALLASGLEANRLTIEITESVILGRTENDLRQIEQLRQMGVRLSLDDFGTGYSSLSYLQSFQLDCIKIDQSFVRRIVSDTRARTIVKAIIDIGRGIDAVTVAEGVETNVQAALLAELGASYLQGYLIGRPMPLESLQLFLEGSVADPAPPRQAGQRG